MAVSRNILKRQIGAYVIFILTPSYICCLEGSMMAAILAVMVVATLQGWPSEELSVAQVPGTS